MMVRPRVAARTDGLSVAAAVDEAAQQQVQAVAAARLLGEDDELGLFGRELEGRGDADRDLLAIVVLNDLPDGEHADVGQNGLRAEDFDAARLRRLVVAEDAHDVDAVVGKNEAAGAGIAVVVDSDRDRAFA